ncbi:hypothetical protein [Pararhizobium mangrovi]|uniref:Uncharacterized protein n=1 Tax=Pararhizobium mangrovi TaxID=2590452 RepID=A0A506U2G7_9HYPH|nr:hypothetical protein [Pararhizobium mangrovi]TPW26067.1 hypothetical protein FJU11_16380 [Pararhizobium mangrovi]
MTKDEERQRQARRELDRLGAEGGLFSTPTLKARARSLRGHFNAEDADPSDRIEVWGTRIGRALALVAFFGLAVWLLFFLAR